MNSDRRQFLLGSGSVLAMTALPLSAQTKNTLDGIQQEPAGQIEGIVAYREADKRSLAYASVLGEVGMTLLPLAGDPVRQWRDRVREAVGTAGMPMYGLTDWSDYLLMKDLNAELRRFPVREQMQAQQDAGNIQWAAELAVKKVQALRYQGTLAEHAADEAVHNGNLFSWEIR